MRPQYAHGGGPAWLLAIGLVACDALLGVGALEEDDRVPSADGARCQDDFDCESDVCAEGVCCDRSCSGPCERCNGLATTGTCTAVAAGTDPQLACSADETKGVCDGAGSCASGAVGWLYALGTTGTDMASSVAVLPDGDVVVAGRFSGTIDVAGTTLVSAGGSDAFVIRLDADGQPRFGVRFGGASDDFVNAVAPTPNGGVVVTGGVRGAAGLPVLAACEPSATVTDAFAAKLDEGGTVQWARLACSKSGGSGQSIAVAPTGEIVFTGTFAGAADLGTGSVVAGGQIDCFLARLDEGGAPTLVAHFNKSGSMICRDVAVDAGGGIYLGGTLDGQAAFGSASIAATASSDAFVAKLDASSAPVWVRTYGGAARQQLNALAVDDSGRVALTGWFESELKVEGETRSSKGLSDVWVALLDPAGAPLWLRTAGDAAAQFGSDVALDSSGNVLVAGAFAGRIELGPPLPSAGDLDAFVAKLSATGVPLWTRRFGDPSPQRAFGLATGDGFIAVGGDFEGSLGSGTTLLASQGAADAFALVLSP